MARSSDGLVGARDPSLRVRMARCSRLLGDSCSIAALGGLLRAASAASLGCRRPVRKRREEIGRPARCWESPRWVGLAGEPPDVHVGLTRRFPTALLANREPVICMVERRFVTREHRRDRSRTTVGAFARSPSARVAKPEASLEGLGVSRRSDAALIERLPRSAVHVAASSMMAPSKATNAISWMSHAHRCESGSRSLS